MMKSIINQNCGHDAVLNDESVKNEKEYSDEAEFERLIQDFINSEIKSGTETQNNESSEVSVDDDIDSEEEEASSVNAEEQRSDEKESLISQAFWRLTGLKSVKEKLNVYEKIVRFNKERAAIGLPSPSMPLHAMFLGSPGTGKTTVARMMGLMLRRAGVLSKGHVVVRERSSLIGPHYGDEEEKTADAIEKAQGGILFIDEAYQLYQQDDPRDPGKLVIEALMTALADESRRDWMLILAGYPEPMKKMFNMNPGFKSRIPDSNIYIFEDFTEQELMEIAERYIENNKFTLSVEAKVALSVRLAADYSQKDKNFGNARHVMNLIQTEVLPAMAMRVISAGLTDAKSLSEIQASDIPAAIKTMRIPHLRRIGYCAKSVLRT